MRDESLGIRFSSRENEALGRSANDLRKKATPRCAAKMIAGVTARGGARILASPPNIISRPSLSLYVFSDKLSIVYLGLLESHMVLLDPFLDHPLVAHPNSSLIASLTVLSRFFSHTSLQTVPITKVEQPPLGANSKIKNDNDDLLSSLTSCTPPAFLGNDASPGERVATRCSVQTGKAKRF